MNENVFIAQDLPFSSSNQQSSPSVEQAAFSAVHNRNEGEENLSMSAHLNGATRQTDICFRFYMCVCVCVRVHVYNVLAINQQLIMLCCKQQHTYT